MRDLSKRSVRICELESMLYKKLREKFCREDARRMTDVLLFGELSGHHSHGLLRMIPGHFGPTDARSSAPPECQSITTTSTRIVGHGNPGMLVASYAMETAIDLAKKTGTGQVVTSGTTTTSGSLAYYLEKITAAGQIGVIAVNSMPLVAAPGGNRKLFGTNPLAIGIPIRDRQPFLLDMSTSAISYGEVLDRRDLDKELPLESAIDADGKPTTDPVAALAGAFLPFGKHKGFGLSLAVELLAGPLSGASFCGIDAQSGWGHVFLTFSLDRFGDPDTIGRNAARLIDYLKDAETGLTNPARIPGEGTLSTREATRNRGSVMISTAIFEALKPDTQ